MSQSQTNTSAYPALTTRDRALKIQRLPLPSCRQIPDRGFTPGHGEQARTIRKENQIVDAITMHEPSCSETRDRGSRQRLLARRARRGRTTRPSHAGRNEDCDNDVGCVFHVLRFPSFNALMAVIDEGNQHYDFIGSPASRAPRLRAR
jgi:hypothetical protein